MIELMAADKDIILGVKAIVTQPVVPTGFLPHLSSASVQPDAPPTSAFHPKQQGFRKIAPQTTTRPSVEHTKQAKLH